MNGKDYGTKFEHLSEALSRLPGIVEGVEVTFEIPGQASWKPVRLRRRPVGFSFQQGTTPIRVESVFPNGHAEELGIREGWVIRRINGVPMEGKDYATKSQFLAGKLSLLPEHLVGDKSTTTAG